MTKVLQEGVSYTFRSYFELPQDTDEVLARMPDASCCPCVDAGGGVAKSWGNPRFVKNFR
jgi:hypothetical protein